MLCPYHNGVNQDDPNAPPGRGRMARVNGTAMRTYGPLPPPTPLQAPPGLFDALERDD